MSTIAFILALGTGGAYAIDQLGSAAIKNNSLRSEDLRNRAAVRGVDVVPDSLGRKEIDESSLVATKIMPVGTSEGPSCALEGSTLVSCGKVALSLPRRGRVLAVATGSLVTGPGATGGASAECAILENGEDLSLNRAIGDPSGDTAPGRGNGFAQTYLSPVVRPAGRYVVEFACRRIGPNPGLIESPTIVAFVLTGR